MGAAETIEKAIERLEEIGDELGWHGWSVQLPVGKPYYSGNPRIWRNDGVLDDGECILIPIELLATVEQSGHWGQYTADAIVTVHRTIEAQLAILREAQKELSKSFAGLFPSAYSLQLALATAILGES